MQHKIQQLGKKVVDLPQASQAQFQEPLMDEIFLKHVPVVILCLYCNFVPLFIPYCVHIVIIEYFVSHSTSLEQFSSYLWPMLCPYFYLREFRTCFSLVISAFYFSVCFTFSSIESLQMKMLSSISNMVGIDQLYLIHWNFYHCIQHKCNIVRSCHS